MQLFFSVRPGCFESHLKRRNRNPLFAPDRRRPSQDEVNEARKRDEQELSEFNSGIRALLDEVGKLPPHVESDVMLGFKDRIEQSYERCAGLAGEHAAEKTGLDRLHALILARMLEGAGDDPYAHWQLDQGEEARRMHHKLLEFPLVAQLLRPDGPVSREELVPTLLSAEEEDIEAAMAMFEPDQRDELVAEAGDLINRLADGFVNLPSLRLRMEAMKRPLEL